MAKLTSDEVHIRRNNAFIKASVIILSGFRGEARAMSAVMHEQHVPRPRRSYESGQRWPNVFPRGLRVGFVRVDQNGDVVFGETVSIDEAAVHPPHVVYASFQLRLCSRVVYSDQNGFFRHYANLALSLRENGNQVWLMIMTLSLSLSLSFSLLSFTSELTKAATRKSVCLPYTLIILPPSCIFLFFDKFIYFFFIRRVLNYFRNSLPFLFFFKFLISL